MLDNLALEIIAGIPPLTALGYTGALTYEEQEVFDLLSGVVRVSTEGGVSGWTPKIAALKNGGSWVDSPLLDGRQLTAASSGNVVETLSCIASGTAQARANAIARLMRLAQQARDFHVEDKNYRPVYLRWWAGGAPADQFALIYSMDVDVQDDPFGIQDSVRVTITIEREPYWRAIAPGDNPKKHTFYMRGLEPAAVSGSGRYNFNDMSITAGTAPYNSYISEPLKYYDEIQRNGNYIDIPAEDIWGDAPALIDLLVVGAPQRFITGKLYVGRSTKRDFYPANDDNSTTQRARNTFNGGDATLTTGGVRVANKVVSANAVLSNDSTTTRYYLEAGISAAAASPLIVATWTRAAVQYTGRYIVFVRGNLLSGTHPTSTLTFGSQSVSFTLGGSFDAIYAGIIDFGAAPIPLFGDGTLSSSSAQVTLQVSGSAAGTLLINDIALLPIDESAANILTGNFDNTGFRTSAKSAFMNNNVFVGQPLTLEPNIDNRLYFISPVLPAGNTDNVFMNFVPRWTGVRDR